MKLTMSEAWCAVQASEAPDQALQLLGMLTSHWLSTDSPHAWPAELLTARTSAEAVQCLPHTLPALMQSSSWQQAGHIAAHSLIRMLPPSRDCVKQPSVAARTAAACLVALRDSLPGEAWKYVPVAVEVLTVAG